MTEHENAGGLCAGRPTNACEVIDATALGAGSLDAMTGAAELAELVPRAARLPLAGAGLTSGILGLPLGVYGLINGASELAAGDTSQGVLDLGASGLAIGSSFSGIANAAGAFGTGWTAGSGMAALSAAAAPLAITAGAVGLGAYGNNYARERGWYGQDPDGSNSTIFGSIGNRAGDGWNRGNAAGRNLLGDTWAGRALGWGLGATSAAGLGTYQSGWNAGAAMWGGVRRVGDGVGSLFATR